MSGFAKNNFEVIYPNLLIYVIWSVSIVRIFEVRQLVDLNCNHTKFDVGNLVCLKKGL